MRLVIAFCLSIGFAPGTSNAADHSRALTAPPSRTALKRAPKRIPRPKPIDYFTSLKRQKRFTDAQISSLAELIRRTSATAPGLPALVFRLADMLAKTAMYWRYQAMELYPKIEAQRHSPTTEKKLRVLQARHFAKSRKAVLLALRTYKDLVTRPTAVFRSFAHMDKALFYYAYTLEHAAPTRRRNAMQKLAYHQYIRLITEYPGSGYAPQALLAIGDRLFEDTRLNKAEAAYTKALQFKHADTYPFALYKKGWVHVNQKRWLDAKAAFFEVARVTKNRSRYAQLYRAARKDFVMAFAQVGAPSKAYAAFTKLDKHTAIDSLSRLADLYLDDGKSKRAVYSYRELLKHAPQHTDICLWQSKIARALLLDNNKVAQARAVSQLAALQRALVARTALPKSTRMECRDTAEELTRRLAQTWHTDASKTRNQPLLESSLRLYRLYLDHFGESKRYADIQWWYAEALWFRAETKKSTTRSAPKATDGAILSSYWKDSARAYFAAAQSSRLSPLRRKNAAEAASLAWSKSRRLTSNATESTQKHDEKTGTSRPATADDLEMLATLRLFRKLAPNAKNDTAIFIRFLEGRLLWRIGRLHDALPKMKWLVSHHPNHEASRFAANILLDILIEDNNQTALPKWVNKIAVSVPSPMGSQLGQRLRKLEYQIAWKRAESLCKHKRFRRCANAYLSMANKDLDHRQAPDWLWNAAYAFEQAKAVGAAIVIYRRMYSRYASRPRTHGGDLARRALLRRGYHLARIGRFHGASNAYGTYALQYSNYADAIDAARKAIYYQRALGNNDKAAAFTRKIAQQFSKPPAVIYR